MPLTAIAVYAPGDIITSAWANILRTNFDVLDARTGGDPAGSGRLALSNGATSTSWQAASAVILGASGLGYTPVNKAGDTMSGSLAAPAHTISALGIVAGSNGLAVTFPGGFAAGNGATITGNATVSGTFTPGSYHGGSTAIGSPAMLGLTVGTSGIDVHLGAINAGVYTGGTTTGGSAAVLGLAVGANGINSSGPVVTGPLTASQYGGGTTAFGSVSANAMAVGSGGLQVIGGGGLTVSGNPVYHAGNPPPAGASVPSGLGAWVPTAAAIPSGWTRYTELDGRVPVGAGTTFSVTYTENTPGGSSWSHQHTGPEHSHSTPAHAHSGADLTITGTTGSESASGASGGTGTNRADSPHTHGAGSLDVAGSTANDGGSTSGLSGTGATSNLAWVIPHRVVVWIRKT